MLTLTELFAWKINFMVYELYLNFSVCAPSFIFITGITIISKKHGI